MEVPIKHFNKKKIIHKEDYIKWKRDTSIGYITDRKQEEEGVEPWGGLHVQWSVSTETYSHHYRASGQSAQVGGIERSWRYLPRQHFLGLPFCLPCPLGRPLVWHSVKIVSTSLTILIYWDIPATTLGHWSVYTWKF